MLLPPKDRRSGQKVRFSLVGSAAPKGCVAVKALGVKVSCGLELVADEAEAEKPSPHCVFWVFVLLGLGACGADILCQLAQSQAKLNVALQLSGVKATLAVGGGSVELEKPKLNRTLGEGCVVVEHMVSAVVVVLASAVGGVVACVPNVGKLRHRGGLLSVDLIQESRSTVRQYRAIRLLLKLRALVMRLSWLAIMLTRLRKV